MCVRPNFSSFHTPYADQLAIVIEREPTALAAASSFLTRHRGEFLKQVEQRKVVLKAQFEAIDTLEYQPSYERAAASASAFLLSL